MMLIRAALASRPARALRRIRAALVSHSARALRRIHAFLASHSNRALRRVLTLMAEPLVAVLLSMLIGGVLIWLFSGLLPGHSAFDLGLPVAAYGALLSGAFGGQNAIIDTLVYSTPLILAGLGVAVGCKAVNEC